MLLSFHNWTCLHIYIYINIYIYKFNCSIVSFGIWQKGELLFWNESLHFQGTLADFCPDKHWPHDALLICWKLLHDQTTFNGSALVEKLLSLNTWKKETHNIAVLYLSATVTPHLDSFPFTLPSLHCNLKREVKLIIIHLPQTVLSKRKHVLVFNSLLVSGYHEYMVLKIFP